MGLDEEDKKDPVLRTADKVKNILLLVATIWVFDRLIYLMGGLSISGIIEGWVEAFIAQLSMSVWLLIVLLTNVFLVYIASILIGRFTNDKALDSVDIKSLDLWLMENAEKKDMFFYPKLFNVTDDIEDGYLIVWVGSEPKAKVEDWYSDLRFLSEYLSHVRRYGIDGFNRNRASKDLSYTLFSLQSKLNVIGVLSAKNGEKIIAIMEEVGKRYHEYYRESDVTDRELHRSYISRDSKLYVDAIFDTYTFKHEIGKYFRKHYNARTKRYYR